MGDWIHDLRTNCNAVRTHYIAPELETVKQEVGVCSAGAGYVGQEKKERWGGHDTSVAV